MSSPTSFIKRALKSALRIFVTPSQVTKIDRLTENFCLIEFSGEKLREANWIPGGKVQLDIGDLTFRTYTPISLDKSEGRLTILCYCREGSPATAWIDSLKVGDSCELFGPRESLDFSSIYGEVALFGDETSYGVSKVLQNSVEKKAHLFFEVTSEQDARSVLRQIGVEDSIMVQRSSDGSRLQTIAQNIIELNSRNDGLSTVFLTGSASSVQLIRSLLKDIGIQNAKLKTRVYWAESKVGLD